MKILFILLLSVYTIIMSYVAVPELIDIYNDKHIESQPSGILDASSARDGQWKFLKDYALLIEYADSRDYVISAGELYRTRYQQRYNITHGYSWTMNSKHLKRRAGDLNLFVDDQYCAELSTSQGCKEAWNDLGEYWMSLSDKNIWGGIWKKTPDIYHFERVE